MKSEVVNSGCVVGSLYPKVKRWKDTNTLALFSSCSHGIIISCDESHDDDFIGKKVEYWQDNNWIEAEDFEVTIKG